MGAPTRPPHARYLFLCLITTGGLVFLYRLWQIICPPLILSRAGLPPCQQSTIRYSTARPAAGRPGEIIYPRIIHQSWKTAELPPKFEKWRETWLQQYPDWDHRLWTDRDNRALIADAFPWFLQTFDNLPEPIHRADAVRYAYMFKYGGIYVDLDMISVKPLTDILAKQNGSVVLGWMGRDFDFEHSIPNAFLASPPGHPFWLLCISLISANANLPGRSKPEARTGPIMLYEAVSAYASLYGPQIPPRPDKDIAAPDEPRGVSILTPGMIYPYSWRERLSADMHDCWVANPTYEEEKCIERYPEAYTITYWSHSWGGDGYLENVKRAS